MAEQDSNLPPPRLVLASASPRRQALLREAGFRFEVRPAGLDESKHPPGLNPVGLAEFLAAGKSRVIAGGDPDAVVLAADTVVAVGETALGKPADAAHARRMLAGLSGTTHAVVTAVAVVRRGAGIDLRATVTSTVHMRRLTDAEIDAYVAGGGWEGKAGGYGIQDQDPFVTRVTGSLTNIVGLPMDETVRLLAAAGVLPG